jgi:aspartate/methionine/tyrosine aminotransferase
MTRVKSYLDYGDNLRYRLLLNAALNGPQDIVERTASFITSRDILVELPRRLGKPAAGRTDVCLGPLPKGLEHMAASNFQRR